MAPASVLTFALVALSFDIANGYTSDSWSSDTMTSPTVSLDPTPTSWSTSWSTSWPTSSWSTSWSTSSWPTSWSTSWSNSWSTSWTTTTSTSTTVSSSAALAAATPTSDCINNDSYQADNYCGCSYSTTCGTHPIYDESTVLLGIYSLGGVTTENHMDYCSDKCDVDNLCLSIVVNVEDQNCYLYNELPIGGTADTNYDLAVRMNNGPGSCVNDKSGVCLANIPTRK